MSPTSQFEILRDVEGARSVSARFDSLDVTALKSAEDLFESVGRRLADEDENFLVSSSHGYYGAPATVYFHLARLRGASILPAERYSTIANFHRFWFAKVSDDYPLRIFISAKETVIWTLKIEKKLGSL